jgi:hypothetical protein
MLNPKYNFDNFVSGECNKEAIQASLLVITNPGFAYNPLFIYSKPGLGKTHLLHAIGNYYQEKNPSKKALYISTDDFIEEFVKYVRGDLVTELYNIFDAFFNALPEIENKMDAVAKKNGLDSSSALLLISIYGYPENKISANENSVKQLCDKGLAEYTEKGLIVTSRGAILAKSLELALKKL